MNIGNKDNNSNNDNPENFDDGLNVDELDLDISLPSMPAIKKNKTPIKKEGGIQGDLSLDLEEFDEEAPATIASPPAPPPEQTPPQHVAQTLTNCPNCQKAVKPNAAICLNCGFNLKTGEKTKLRTDDGTMPEMRMKEILAKKKAEKLASQDSSHPVTEKEKRPDKIIRDSKGRPLSEGAKQVAEEYHREAFVIPGIASIVGLVLCLIGIYFIQLDASMQFSWRTGATIMDILLSHSAVFSVWMISGLIGIFSMVALYGYSFELKSGLLRLFAVLSNTYAAGLFGFVLFGLLSGGRMAMLGYSFAFGLELFIFFFMGMWIFKFHDFNEIRTFFLTSRVLPYAALYLGFIPFTHIDIDEATERAVQVAKDNIGQNKGEYVRILPRVGSGSVNEGIQDSAKLFTALGTKGFEPYSSPGIDGITEAELLEGGLQWAAGSLLELTATSAPNFSETDPSEAQTVASDALWQSESFNQAKKLMRGAIDQYHTPILTYLNANLPGTYQIEGDPAPFLDSYIILENWHSLEKVKKRGMLICRDVCRELSPLSGSLIEYKVVQVVGLRVRKKGAPKKKIIHADDFRKITDIKYENLVKPRPIPWKLVFQKLKYDVGGTWPMMDDTRYNGMVQLPVEPKTLLENKFQFKYNMVQTTLGYLGFSGMNDRISHYVFVVK